MKKKVRLVLTAKHLKSAHTSFMSSNSAPRFKKSVEKYAKELLAHFKTDKWDLDYDHSFHELIRDVFNGDLFGALAYKILEGVPGLSLVYCAGGEWLLTLDKVKPEAPKKPKKKKESKK